MLAASFNLPDAQATPVQHTFVPNGRDDKGVFWFIDRSPTNAIGYLKVSVEFKEPPPASAGIGSKDRTYRVRLGVHVPVLETLSNSTVTGITPSPTIAYVPRMFIESVVPERSTSTDRKTLRTMGFNLLGIPQIRAIIEDLDRLY